MMHEKINWKSIIKLLKDKENWKFTGFQNEVQHISGIRFYIDLHGIVFRDEKDKIICKPNPLIYILTTIYSIKLKKYLERRKTNG
jgi:hypothetical protein